MELEKFFTPGASEISLRSSDQKEDPQDFQQFRGSGAVSGDAAVIGSCPGRLAVLARTVGQW